MGCNCHLQLSFERSRSETIYLIILNSVWAIWFLLISLLLEEKSVHSVKVVCKGKHRLWPLNSTVLVLVDKFSEEERLATNPCCCFVFVHAGEPQNFVGFWVARALVALEAPSLWQPDCQSWKCLFWWTKGFEVKGLLWEFYCVHYEQTSQWVDFGWRSIVQFICEKTNSSLPVSLFSLTHFLSLSLSLSNKQTNKQTNKQLITWSWAVLCWAKQPCVRKGGGSQITQTQGGSFDVRPKTPQVFLMALVGSESYKLTDKKPTLLHNRFPIHLVWDNSQCVITDSTTDWGECGLPRVRCTRTASSGLGGSCLTPNHRLMHVFQAQLLSPHTGMSLETQLLSVSCLCKQHWLYSNGTGIVSFPVFPRCSNSLLLARFVF